MNARRRAPLRFSPTGASANARAATVVALCLAAVFAAVASAARPFTEPADVAVSIPSAIFAGALVMERFRPESGPWRRMDRTRPADGNGTAVPWLVVVALFVAVELASYFHSGPRADYPTLSSGIEAFFRYRAAKAAGWFVWLTVGWFLVRR